MKLKKYSTDKIDTLINKKKHFFCFCYFVVVSKEYIVSFFSLIHFLRVKYLKEEENNLSRLPLCIFFKCRNVKTTRAWEVNMLTLKSVYKVRDKNP